MKKLFFACLLAAMVSPAFSTVYPKVKYCQCTGIGMPESSTGSTTKKAEGPKSPSEILLLRIQLWGYLYGF